MRNVRGLMIQAESVGMAERRANGRRDRWKEDLFLHADLAQQAGTECTVALRGHVWIGCHIVEEQDVQASIIVDQGLAARRTVIPHHGSGFLL